MEACWPVLGILSGFTKFCALTCVAFSLLSKKQYFFLIQFQWEVGTQGVKQACGLKLFSFFKLF